MKKPKAQIVEEALIKKTAYTKERFIDEFGKRKWNKFSKWMYGQTFCIIDGKSYYYECDVDRFINGLPVID